MLVMDRVSSCETTQSIDVDFQEVRLAIVATRRHIMKIGTKTDGSDSFQHHSLLS